MTCELIAVKLTDEQKGQVCGILSVGCDRQTAANFVGCSLVDIRRAMQQDAQFAASICHAEALSELSHMRNVQQAAKDAKNWRASVWWLERRSPERFGKRGAGVVTSRQLKAFVAILVDILSEDIHDAADRQRLAARLQSIGDTVDQILRDAGSDASDAAASAGPSPPDVSEDGSEALSDEDLSDADGASW